MTVLDYDVLVLGAGAAGLAAARSLCGSGKRIAVIEGRQRVGGRILTDRASIAGGGIPLELGAEFIHGLPPETWALVREAELPTAELDGTALAHRHGRLMAMDEHGGTASAVLDEMARWFHGRPPGTDATFAQYLAGTSLSADPRNDAIRYVEGFNAADHRIIGVAALLAQQAAEDGMAAERLFHVESGYDALPEFLKHRIEAARGVLHLGRTVRSVQWSRGAVRARGTDSEGREFEFRAAQAVVALPLGVLQSGGVHFDPAPGGILHHARRLAMGQVVRIPLLFRSRFWSEAKFTQHHPRLEDELERLGFLFTDQGAPATFWTAYPSCTATIVAWVGGPAAAEMARGLRVGNEPRRPSDARAPRDPRAPAAIGLAALSRIFDLPRGFLEDQLLHWAYHDWQADPFALGAYSYAPAHAADASVEMSRPVADTLFFAGEHVTVTGQWGTVNGALQSGYAAAERLMGVHALVPVPTNTG